MTDDLTPAGASAVRLAATVAELRRERDRARGIAVELEGRLARVAALADRRDVVYPPKFRFGAAENFVAGYCAARNDLRAALEADDA